LEFETTNRDVLGRIGTLKTKSGVIEIPHLFPVVNPAVQPVAPREIREKMHCNAIMTNGYLIKNQFGEEAVKKGVHQVLDFEGVIAMDSGAYQILTYGEIKADPLKIARFEEEVAADIATILDVPTGWDANREYAEWTVKETLTRADQTLAALSRKDIAWVGPIQGGIYLDLLANSAREMAGKPFEILALGSPTQIMERYMFDKLVDMVLTAKMNIPFGKPLHLFGAGHPFMFAMAVALGCDLFDSAAYAIYARSGRYLTEYGTLKIDELQHFPCSCPVCTSHEPKKVKELERVEREKILAKHNLYVCLEEIRRVKQAILEGRLWELMELRAQSHPSLLQALKRLKLYQDFIEKHSPSTKKRGVFYFGSQDLSRPEVVRHRKRITENYSPPEKAEILLLLPQSSARPYHKSPEIKRNLGRQEDERIHACVYAAPFGVVPLEIDDVYPLSQTELVFPPDKETVSSVADAVVTYIRKNPYRIVVLVPEKEVWGKEIIEECKKICKNTGKKFALAKNSHTGKLINPLTF